MRRLGSHRALHALRLALAMATAGLGRLAAASPAEESAPLAARRAEHISRVSPGAAVGSAPESAPGALEVAPVIGAARGALVIEPTFDSSITANPNAAAIEATINEAIGIYESLFNDPIAVSILFRYTTTSPDGTSLPAGTLSLSDTVAYVVPWQTYIDALTTDATTSNDISANASLPGTALSTFVDPSSANGRAIGLDTPPAMFANGNLATGGPYDGIVTLNSREPFQFTRPPTNGMLDALRAIEHEMDEVLGLGSYLPDGGDLRPEDLFGWSAPGTRNLTSRGSRYLSIDGGSTDIVGLNQNPSGDFGDWLSGPCPQATPFVQNAFTCMAQASDVSATSPEGVALDVIGYDLLTSTSTTTPRISGTTTTATTTTTTSTTLLTCGAAPTSGCQPAAAHRAHLMLGKGKLVWKWTSSAVVPSSDFGDPRTANDYVLCIYDTSVVTLSALAPSGGTCGKRPCWRALGAAGFTYDDRGGAPDGLTKIVLRAGGAGRGKIVVKGGGVNLHLPSLPLTTPVRVQLRQSSVCWEATYSTASRNTASTFKAKSD